MIKDYKDRIFAFFSIIKYLINYIIFNLIIFDIFNFSHN